MRPAGRAAVTPFRLVGPGREGHRGRAGSRREGSPTPPHSGLRGRGLGRRAPRRRLAGSGNRQAHQHHRQHDHRRGVPGGRRLLPPSRDHGRERRRLPWQLSGRDVRGGSRLHHLRPWQRDASDQHHLESSDDRADRWNLWRWCCGPGPAGRPGQRDRPEPRRDGRRVGDPESRHRRFPHGHLQPGRRHLDRRQHHRSELGLRDHQPRQRRDDRRHGRGELHESLHRLLQPCLRPRRSRPVVERHLDGSGQRHRAERRWVGGPEWLGNFCNQHRRHDWWNRDRRRQRAQRQYLHGRPVERLRRVRCAGESDRYEHGRYGGATQRHWDLGWP